MRDRQGLRAARRLLTALVAALVALAAVLAVPGAALAEDAAARSDSQVTVWRLYNRWSGEHLFTTDREEYDGLVAVGWSGEGEAWSRPRRATTRSGAFTTPTAGTTTTPPTRRSTSAWGTSAGTGRATRSSPPTRGTGGPSTASSTGGSPRARTSSRRTPTSTGTWATSAGAPRASRSTPWAAPAVKTFPMRGRRLASTTSKPSRRTGLWSTSRTRTAPSGRYWGPSLTGRS